MTTMFRRLTAVSLAAAALGLVAPSVIGAAGRLGVKLDVPAPEMYQRVEIAVEGVPAGGNPFDPASIAVDLDVTTPSGRRVKVPGYYDQEFDRELKGDREQLTARGEGRWRVRWLPLEAGRHQLTFTASVSGKVVARGKAASKVGRSARRGVARVESNGRRSFELGDGTPLFLNGLCACWHGKRGTYDYDDWLAAYEKTGINYMRLWMWPEAFGIEWDRGDLGRYRMDSAWRLDRVMAEAERRGVYVMLCLDYHGMFEVKPDFWNGNNFWPRNPYNATNGGPCQVQNDFFTNEQARHHYEKRLRYIVARWSAFPNLLAWEFFNEIDNEYMYLKHEDVVAWHGAMGKRLRSLDPVQHLISSSFTGNSERPDLFALPEMDFAQYHSYNEKHPARMTAEKSQRFFEKYRKPFFVSEYGTDWKGWKPDTDPHLRALHQAVWSGAFAGAAGTGMTWWWENIHSANLYRHWSALAAFLSGTGIGKAELKPAQFGASAGGVLPLGLSGPNEALVWLLDRGCDWPEGALEANPTPVARAAVTLLGMSDGPWQVSWWDTLTGREVAAGEAVATGGSLTVIAPPFQADIAARLKRR
jgi:hypothetical protein